MTAGFGLITLVVMVFQRTLRSCFFCLLRSHKDLPQACRVKRPLLGVKVIKVRIDAAADKFQFRHLPGSPAIWIGITQLANGNKPAGVGSAFVAIAPTCARAPFHSADDIIAPGVSHHQQLTGLASQAFRQTGIERLVRLDHTCIEG